MRASTFLLAACALLLTGSITQIYHQDVSESGSSVISEELDVSLFAQFMPEGSLQDMATICAFEEGLRCSLDVENARLYVERDFNPGGSYYTYSAEYGLPYVEYTLTVNKVPKDRFGDAMNDIVDAAGIETAEGSGVAALDLRERESGIKSAERMELFGIEILYRVEMPGDITSAGAGGYEAEISGRAATFSLGEVLKDPAPLVVKSRQLNWLYIVIILGSAAVVALALSFLGNRRKARPAREGGPPPGKAARKAAPARRKKRK